ncbi:MAG: Ig-like domain-containing protein, partial [Firmicutes bacterium]|nr:Ig-like domain-containing protein [Bacillota bacterium]
FCGIRISLTERGVKMKKNIIKRGMALILAAAMITGYMPTGVYAADVTKTLTVENVKTHLTFFGTHYITYTINGVDYDSRTCGTQFNLDAFRNMEYEDKRNVSGFYLHDDRREQFGEVGAQEMCDTINDSLGYTHAWKVMHDRAQNYCKELIPYYGGVSAEDDPDRYYNEEYTKLNTFTGDAKTLIDSYYSSQPEAQAFNEKHRMMNELMTTGKTAYDNCVKHNEFAREAAVKASSAWLIKFIVENTIVPGLMSKPSATAAGVDSAMNTVYDQVLGMISEITGAENVSVTAEGNIVNLTIGKMGGQNISLKKGAEMVTYMRELAEKNYQLAKYAHEKAVEFHDQLEAEASEVIRKIQEREKKQEKARAAEQAKNEQNKQKTNTDNVKPDTSKYSSITQPEQKTDENDEDYKKRQQAYINSLISAAKTLDGDVSALYSQMLSEAESVSQNAGFYVDNSITESDYVRFTGYYDPLYNIVSSKYNELYYAITSEEEYKRRPKKFDEETELKNNCVLKINTIESSLNGVTDRYAVLYKELVARRMALYDKGAYSYYTLDTNKWNDLTGLFSRVNDIVYGLTSERTYIEASLEILPEEHKRNMEAYENEKTAMQERLNNYLTAQANFNLASAMYADIAKQQSALAHSGLPDYVYTQNFLSYGYDIPLADGSNNILTSKINSASDKHKFFKDEAAKLEECIEKFSLYDKQKTVAYNYAKYYLRELAELDHKSTELWSGSMGYLNVDMFKNYGIDPKEFVQYREMENELKALFKANYEDSGRIAAAKALFADFTGAGVYHNMFLQRYNDMVKKAPLYKRKIASGELTLNSFNYYYADVLLEPYNTLQRSNMKPSYSGAYTDIDTNNEKAFKDMLYGTNGILDDIRSAADTYKPVESVVNQSRQSEFTLAQGESVVLKVSVQPANANVKDVYWFSEDENIAAVDKNGKVTGTGEGTTTVCAISKDAPMSEVKDDFGDVLYYTAPDEFVVRFNINITDELVSKDPAFGDADGDNVVTANDATFVLQKTLKSTFELPIQKKTDDWLKYADVDADNTITASDSAFILQKTLISTFELPAEKKNK